MNSNKVCLGVITSPHGVKGHVKVKSYCENSGDITSYGTLTDKTGKPFKLKIIGHTTHMLICSIDGLTDRNEAQLLSNTQLFADRDALPKSSKEEGYLHVDLVGMVVIEAGKEIGTVKAIENYGAGEHFRK